MKTFNFPYIALGLGLFLMLLLVKGGEASPDGGTLLPLLTLMIISEFAFFMTAFAVYIGVKHIRVTGMTLIYTLTTLLCFLLSLRFAILGIELWPL